MVFLGVRELERVQSWIYTGFSTETIQLNKSWGKGIHENLRGISKGTSPTPSPMAESFSKGYPDLPSEIHRQNKFFSRQCKKPPME